MVFLSMSSINTIENWFFVRGLVRESGHWHDFIQKFQQKFPHRNVFLLDLPGNGEHYFKKSPYSIREMSDFLREDFFKKLPKKSPATAKNYLFSISLGSMVCLEWMQKYPNDIAGAFLINTSLRGLSAFYRRLRPQNYFKRLKLFFSTSPLKIEKEILSITSNNHAFNEQIAMEWEKIHILRPVSKKNALAQIIAAASYLPKKQKPSANIQLLASYSDRLVHFSCTEKIQKLWGVKAYYHETAGHDLTLDASEWVLEKCSI